MIVGYASCCFPLLAYVMNDREFFSLPLSEKPMLFLPAQFDPIYEQKNDKFVHFASW